MTAKRLFTIDNDGLDSDYCKSDKMGELCHAICLAKRIQMTAHARFFIYLFIFFFSLLIPFGDLFIPILTSFVVIVLHAANVVFGIEMT